ncbi:hypothetical protein GCM10027072_05590 [Streptomyces bullii]
MPVLDPDAAAGPGTPPAPAGAPTAGSTASGCGGQRELAPEEGRLPQTRTAAAVREAPPREPALPGGEDGGRRRVRGALRPGEGDRSAHAAERPGKAAPVPRPPEGGAPATRRPVGAST